MKNRLLILLCAMLSVVSLSAGDKKYDGTTITISSNVKLPVYIRWDGKELKITSREYTTSTMIPCLNATIRDADGNLCIRECATDQGYDSNGVYTHYYHDVTGVYSSSSSSSSSNSSSSTSGSSSSYSSDSRASELGRAWAGAASATRSYDYSAGYTPGGFSITASVSAAWGENLELRFRYGSSSFGGDVTGMVGYDWINGKPDDKLTWNAGIGAYFGGRPEYYYLWDVDFGVKFGKSNKPFNNAWTCMLDLNTTHLICPEHVIGLFAGAGIGLGGNKPDFVWDVRGGIVIYFLQWNWF